MNLKHKNILITGGAGYLGGAITSILMNPESEHEFRVYDNLLYEDAFLKDVPFVCGDVRDPKALDPQLDWADVVIWLAALVGDGACAVDPVHTSTWPRRSMEGSSSPPPARCMADPTSCWTRRAP